MRADAADWEVATDRPLVGLECHISPAARHA